MSGITAILFGILLWLGFLIIVLPLLFVPDTAPERDDPEYVSEGWRRRHEQGRDQL